MNGSKTKLHGILVIVIVVAGSALAAIYLMQPHDAGPSITVIGADATEQDVYLSEMQAMDIVSGYTSFQNSFGNVRGQGTYSGVRISDLIELVGGMNEEDRITVNATDGYEVTYGYQKVYPSGEILDLQGDMILAFEYNGTVVPEWEDGYRVIFVPEDGYYDSSDAEATTSENLFGGAAGPQCVASVETIKVNNIAPSAIAVQTESETLEFTMDEILGMPSITADAGYVKSTGTIEGPFTYTGVELEYLLNQTEYLPPEYGLEVVASDGYTGYFNSTEALGELRAYDSTTGDIVGQRNFTAILAYYEDDEPLTNGGPIRMVFFNDGGYFTDGHYWIKDVVNITVLNQVESWQLQLSGVESFNMTHDVFYSAASCTHHRKTVTNNGTEYEGLALWTIVSAMDGADDEHFQFNSSLVTKNYTVTLYDSLDNSVSFNAYEIAYNDSLVLAVWTNGELLGEPDWPIRLVSEHGDRNLGNIAKIEMTGWE